jgi:hypothetical protein
MGACLRGENAADRDLRGGPRRSRALQVTGFAVMTLALCILGVSDTLEGEGGENVFIGFDLFNTFMNLRAGRSRAQRATSARHPFLARSTHRAGPRAERERAHR